LQPRQGLFQGGCAFFEQGLLDEFLSDDIGWRGRVALDAHGLRRQLAAIDNEHDAVGAVGNDAAALTAARSATALSASTLPTAARSAAAATAKPAAAATGSTAASAWLLARSSLFSGARLLAGLRLCRLTFGRGWRRRLVGSGRRIGAGWW
jgi:hypothetical protein